MPVAILLALVGVIPGLIVFLLIQRAKRYQAECPNCGRAVLLKVKEAEPVKSSWGGAQFYDSNGEAVPDGQMLARAGKWLLVGVAGLVGIVVLLGVAGVGLQKLGFVSESAGTNMNNVDQDALAYVGREPDAAFFKLPRVRAAFQKVIESDAWVQFEEDRIRHLDFEKCQLEGRSILSLAWSGRITSGIEGSIAAIDLSNGRIVLASQEDEPRIDVRGDVEARNLSQLPREVQRWIERMKLQTAEQTGVSVAQIPVRFMMLVATTDAAAHEDAGQAPLFPSGDRYVAAVRDGVLESHDTTTIGRAFEATFTHCRWQSGETAKGVRFVEFTGRLRADACKTTIEALSAKRQECTSEVREWQNRPFAMYLRSQLQRNDSSSGVDLHPDVTLLRQMIAGGQDEEALRLAVWSDSRFNNVRNNLACARGVSTQEFDYQKKVREYCEADIAALARKMADGERCGEQPTLATFPDVKFQFTFTADGNSFSVSYFDPEPWRVCVFWNSPNLESVLAHIYK